MHIHTYTKTITHTHTHTHTHTVGQSAIEKERDSNSSERYRKIAKKQRKQGDRETGEPHVSFRVYIPVMCQYICQISWISVNIGNLVKSIAILRSCHKGY